METIGINRQTGLFTLYNANFEKSSLSAPIHSNKLGTFTENFK